MGKKYEQIIISSTDESITGKNITQIGINGKPGSIVEFYFNNDYNKLIKLGQTGIFELNVEDFTIITSVEFETIGDNKEILVDIVYTDANQEGGN